MSLPHTFTSLTTGQMSYLDDNFAAVGALTTVPCTAVGTNTVALTGFANTPSVPAYANHMLFSFVASGNSSAAVTLNVNGLGARSLYLPSGAAAGSGALIAGNFYVVGYNAALNSGAGGFQVLFGASSTDAVARPVRASFKRLVIVNGGTPNSQVSVDIDEIVLEASTGATYKGSNVSLTLSTLSTGANGLDAGSVAASTWYSVWVIWNGTTVAGLLSTSTATPILPSGYTYSARIGWVRTNGSSNLIRIRQQGREARYVGASLPIMASGASGSTTVPTWTAIALGNYTPPTTSIVNVVGVCSGASAVLMIAPNNSFGAYNTTTNTPPLVITSSGAGAFDSRMVALMAETTDIYYAAAQAGNVVLCYGWQDNI